MIVIVSVQIDSDARNSTKHEESWILNSDMELDTSTIVSK